MLAGDAVEQPLPFDATNTSQLGNYLQLKHRPQLCVQLRQHKPRPNANLQSGRESIQQNRSQVGGEDEIGRLRRFALLAR